MKLDITNRFSTLGLIFGLGLGFFIRIWFAILIMAVIWLIMYKATRIDKDDSLQFMIFGMIGVVIMFIIGLFLSSAIL